MGKIEAFQDVKDKPIEIVPPVPSGGTEPIAERPVFRQTLTEKPLEQISDTPQTPPAPPETPFIVRRDIPDQPVERLSGDVSQPVQEVRDSVFRGSVPTNPFERGR